MNLSMPTKSKLKIKTQKGCEFAPEKGRDRGSMGLAFFSFKTGSRVAQAGLDLTL